MNPRIGKRSKYNSSEKPPDSMAVVFIKRNTKKSITLKQEYLYLQDVKSALNIHHLELSIKLKRELIKQLRANPHTVIESIENSIEHDRHRLQKKYRISL